MPEDYLISWTAEYECVSKHTGTVDLDTFSGHCEILWNVNYYPDEQYWMFAQGSYLNHSKINNTGPCAPDSFVTVPKIPFFNKQIDTVTDFYMLCGGI